MSQRSNQDGFTLIELLVSLTILAAMMLIVWTTTTGAVFARKNLNEAQERDHEIRVAMTRITRDLGSAYISANERTTGLERRTMFIGKDDGDVHELQFSTMAHMVLWADANESEQTVVTYKGEPDPDNRSITNLVRYELRRPPNDNRDEEKPEIDTLVRDVQKVHFEYYDWREKDWSRTWDSTQADGERGRVPTRVRIVIELEEENDEQKKRTLRFETQARIMLQEELRFFAN